MPRIAVQPEWTAEYEIASEGDVILSQLECDGEAVPWKRVPECVERLLCAAAREAEEQSRRDLAGEQADLEILRRKEGER